MYVVPVSELTYPLVSWPVVLPRATYYVYALVKDETILYIGHSIRLAGRLQAHHRNSELWSQLTDVWILVAKDRATMLGIEAQHLHYHKPMYNKQDW